MRAIVSGSELIMTLDGGLSTTVREAYERKLTVASVNHDLRTAPEASPVIRKLDPGSVGTMVRLKARSGRSRITVDCGEWTSVLTTAGAAYVSSLRRNAMAVDVYGSLRSLKVEDDCFPDFSLDAYEVTSEVPALIMVNDLYVEV